MINLQIYDTPNKDALLADFSGRARGLKFSTSRHGFAAAAWRVEMDLFEAFAAYDWPGTPHVVISDRAASTVWEGRLEDIAIVDDGAQFGAFGYWRALTDAPYTALWSKTGSGGWQVVTSSDIGNRRPDRYEMDNNNRLHIALRKGEAFSNNNHFGEFSYSAPHLGSRNINAFSCDYDITLPADFELRLQRRDYDNSSPTVIQTIVGTGSNQTGTINQSWSGSGQQRVAVHIYNNTGSTYTMAGETGSFYALLTNIRVHSGAPGSTILASNIAIAMAAYINGINSSQLSASSALITATSTDLRDELYEDVYPAEILDRLALLHNYQAAVYEDRRLQFRPKADVGRTWYVDVTRIVDLQRSLDPLRNSAYAIYREAGGRTLRTAVANDAASQARYGLARRGFVSVQTSSQTEAETHRDAFLSDRADYAVRASIDFERVYTAYGAAHSLHEVRAGDTLVMRNLPPTLSAEIDNIRSFRVAATEYDVEADVMRVEPETPTPTLVTLLAQREAGL